MVCCAKRKVESAGNAFHFVVTLQLPVSTGKDFLFGIHIQIVT